MTLTPLILLAALLAMATPTIERTDFLALFMETVVSNDNSEATANYRYITVGPKGIEELHNMLSADSEQKGNEREALEYIHTLRVFEADSAVQHYAQMADSILSSRAKTYQPFAKRKGEAARKSSVWLRKNGRKVIEMIVVLRREEEKQQLQIVNVTGNLSKDFIEKLMKL